jgi:hypothetical protein
MRQHEENEGNQATLFRDDFREGLSHEGPGAPWSLREVEGMPGATG